MSKVITFSTVFPSYHIKKGEPTFFVEKIVNSFAENLFKSEQSKIVSNLPSKKHTIRVGKRWKEGDLFSPRIWSGRPYFSKQEIFFDDIKIKKIYDFDLIGSDYFLNGKELSFSELKWIAENDGFENLDDLELWFQKPFSGQVICWQDPLYQQ